MSKKEIDQDVLDNIRSREIVQEILDFGVKEHQIKKIIKFLALELEDRGLMLSLCEILDGESETQKSKIEL